MCIISIFTISIWLLVICKYCHLPQTLVLKVNGGTEFFLRPHLGNICVTHSQTTHLTFTCVVRSPNCIAYFGQSENGG
jgi:hypothetical protein